jgi:hypothetical protein
MRLYHKYLEVRPHVVRHTHTAVRHARARPASPDTRTAALQRCCRNAAGAPCAAPSHVCVCGRRVSPPQLVAAGTFGRVLDELYETGKRVGWDGHEAGRAAAGPHAA